MPGPPALDHLTFDLHGGASGEGMKCSYGSAPHYQAKSVTSRKYVMYVIFQYHLLHSQDDRQNKWNRRWVGKYQRDSFRSCSCTEDQAWSASSVNELCLTISDRNTQRISSNNKRIGHQAGQVKEARTQNIAQFELSTKLLRQSPDQASARRHEFASIRVNQTAGKTVHMLRAFHRFCFISGQSYCVAELECFTNLKCLVNVGGFLYLKVTMWILLFKSHLDHCLS